MAMLRVHSSAQSSTMSHSRQMDELDAWRFSPMRTASQSTLEIPSIHVDKVEEERVYDEETLDNLWNQVWEDVDVDPSVYAQVPRRLRSNSIDTFSSFSSDVANPSLSTSTVHSIPIPPSEEGRAPSRSALASVYSLSSLRTRTSRHSSPWTMSRHSAISRLSAPSRISTPRDSKIVSRPVQKMRSSVGRGGSGNIIRLESERLRFDMSSPMLPGNINTCRPIEEEGDVSDSNIDAAPVASIASSTGSSKPTSQVAIAIPCTHPHRSHCSARQCTRTAVPSISSTNFRNSSAAYHAMPIIAEVEDPVSSLDAPTSSTTYSYLRSYASCSSLRAPSPTPSNHFEVHSDSELETSPRSPPSLHLHPSESLSEDDVPADCVKTTTGREFHVDLALFVDAFASSVDLSSRSTSPESSNTTLNVPTHTGADPPSPESSEVDIASTRSAKKIVKSTLGLLRICEQAPLEKQLRAILKQKARTGRGGYGNPGKMILEQMKYKSSKKFPRTASVIEKFDDSEAAQEYALIEKSIEESKHFHSTGRGGVGNSGKVSRARKAKNMAAQTPPLNRSISGLL